MLPAHLKLTSPVQFKQVIKGGKRAGTRTVVVHYLDRNQALSQLTEVAASGPRFGLVVSKAVGNAVVRHRTSRRIRHLCMALVETLPTSADIVIRALPASGTASSEQLEKDLHKALKKVKR